MVALVAVVEEEALQLVAAEELPGVAEAVLLLAVEEVLHLVAVVLEAVVVHLPWLEQAVLVPEEVVDRVEGAPHQLHS